MTLQLPPLCHVPFHSPMVPLSLGPSNSGGRPASADVRRCLGLGNRAIRPKSPCNVPQMHLPKQQTGEKLSRLNHLHHLTHNQRYQVLRFLKYILFSTRNRQKRKPARSKDLSCHKEKSNKRKRYTPIHLKQTAPAMHLFCCKQTHSRS